MKKQIILCLCALTVASCSSLDGKDNADMTLADIFVWGDDHYPEHKQKEKISETHTGLKIRYNEKDTDEAPKKEYGESIRGYKVNDDIEVKYVEVRKDNNKETDVVDDETYNHQDKRAVAIKEVIIEAENPDENTETYILAKRSDRYKEIEETFSPNVYAVVAARVTNKMLEDLPAIMAKENDPTMYIEDTVYADRFMPFNPDAAGKTVKEIVTGSRMIKLVDSADAATYVLKGRMNNINTPEIPVFKYGLGLYDKKGKLINRWSDTIRQVQNDDGSWW